MYCENCGTQLNENQKFCGVCGEKIIKDAPSAIEKNDENITENQIDEPSEKTESVGESRPQFCRENTFNSESSLVSPVIEPQEDLKDTSSRSKVKHKAILVAVGCLLVFSLFAFVVFHDWTSDEERIKCAEAAILSEDYETALLYIDEMKSSSEAEILEAYISFHKATVAFSEKCSQIGIESEDNDLLTAEYENLLTVINRFEENYTSDRLREELKNYFYMYAAASDYVESTYGPEGYQYWSLNDLINDMQGYYLNLIERRNSYYDKDDTFSLGVQAERTDESLKAYGNFKDFDFKIIDPPVIRYCKDNLESENGEYFVNHSIFSELNGSSALTDMYKFRLDLEQDYIETKLEKWELDDKLYMTAVTETDYPFESFYGDCYVRISSMADTYANTREKLEALRLEVFCGLVGIDVVPYC
ncbi:MAG: zinc ribbon domain-containing protein [Clostridia bacterium]|nr:zinc ribbon domain-containing protein [Clostridia bacterium]